jgi:hypothetical protein
MRSKPQILRMSVVSFAVSLLILIFCRGACAEHIKYLDADIHIRKDASVYIIEDYVYDFEASNRYGFYRNIPLTYTSNGRTYSVDFHLVSVKNSEGDLLRSKVSAHDDAVTITVGDPRVAVSGRRVYRIEYILRSGLHFASGVPEFNWSITGAECPVPIGRTVVRIYTPPGTSFDTITKAAYIDSPGNTENITISNGHNYIQVMSGTLAPSDELIVNLDFPKGSIAKPSVFKEILYWLIDWWPTLLLPLLTGFSIGAVWWHYGRDASSVGKPATTWDPPTDMSPAEVGTLYDERCDMQDMVATLIDLAARGHLKIKEAPLSLQGQLDYVFTKTDAAKGDPALRNYEKLFLYLIFGSGGHALPERKLSDLENQFYDKIPDLRDQIYDAMTQEGYFMQNPETVRQNCTSLALFYCLVGMLLILASSNEATLAPYGIGVVISAAIIGTFAFAMPARTLKGVQALRRSIGFAGFISAAGPRRIDLIAKEDPEIFGRVLPYALVLGVADQWAEEFRGVLKQPPDWYEPISNGDFSSSEFVVSLGAGMRAMETTMLSEPADSSTVKLNLKTEGTDLKADD